MSRWTEVGIRKKERRKKRKEEDVWEPSQEEAC
jgi:hypothetical protein